MSEPQPRSRRATTKRPSGNFVGLFARNLPPLIAFIRSRAGKAIAARESAADLAQSVFREVLMDVDRIELRGEAAFRNWLFMVTRNKCLEKARRKVLRVDGHVRPEDEDHERQDDRRSDHGQRCDALPVTAARPH